MYTKGLFLSNIVHKQAWKRVRGEKGKKDISPLGGLKLRNTDNFLIKKNNNKNMIITYEKW